MTARSSQQSGFALLEALLIIIIVAIIGFTGWYAWHSKQSVDKTLGTTQSASSIPSAHKSNPPAATSAPTKKTLTIQQWGVKANYTSSVTLQYYIIPELPQTAVSFGSLEAVALNSSCSAKNQAAGIIDRYTADETVSRGDDPQPSDPTAQALATSLPSSDYAHVGDYYYFYKSPQGLCGGGGGSMSSGTTRLEAVQNQTIEAVQEVLANLQAE